MIYKADLHIHSCLSPCADDAMTPQTIVRLEKKRGVNLCALTDHNSAKNCPPFWELCLENGITPLAGLEVSSVEQVHVLALFDRLEKALEFSSLIFESLTAHKALTRHYGKQYVVDKESNILGTEDVFLTVPCKYTFRELFELVPQYGGLFIPAHIKRPMFSVMSQLGSLPDLDYDILDMYVPEKIDDFPVICSSDAHWPDALAFRTTEFRISEQDEKLPVLEQIKKAAKAASFSTFSPGK
jgi:3',5'-nucleoside bisphosphate phosphatase